MLHNQTRRSSSSGAVLRIVMFIYRWPYVVLWIPGTRTGWGVHARGVPAKGVSNLYYKDMCVMCTYGLIVLDALVHIGSLDLRRCNDQSVDTTDNQMLRCTVLTLSSVSSSCSLAYPNKILIKLLQYRLMYMYPLLSGYT